MTVIEIFSSPINYKYKTRICSSSFLIVLLLVVLSLVTPFFLLFNIEGFWIRTKVYAETADVFFQYKYLLLVEKDEEAAPTVCSTFLTYKENIISDDCSIIKVQEIDKNNDGKKDVLKFEAHFYTDVLIKNVKLFLFFEFKLKQLLEGSIQSIAILDYISHQEDQKINFVADLELKQSGVLRSDHFYDIYNQSIELQNWTLLQLISQNINKKFSAQITNAQLITQAGFSKEEAIIVQGELHYKDYLIHFQPSLWEELKWAWIQYISCFLVFIYLTNSILKFLFSSRYLNSYIVVPWEAK